MSRFTGPQGKGALKAHRNLKRSEASMRIERRARFEHDEELRQSMIDDIYGYGIDLTRYPVVEDREDAAWYHAMPSGEFPDWCSTEGCTAPLINGTPLCHHPKEN